MFKPRNIRWAGHETRMSTKRNTCRILKEKPKGKRPLERPRHRWKINIKMYLIYKGWGDADWTDLAQDRN
jgi:hypothetical protein